MATKKKGLARSHRRAKSAKRIVSAPSSNPPLFTDLVEFIIPGFAGYAATRFTSRIVRGLAEKRFPRLGKHAAVLSSLAAFGASWLLVHRVKKVAKYHTPVTVGAAIAALQTTVQTYLPKYGWIVSDYQEQKQIAPSAAAAANQLPNSAPPITENLTLQPSIDEQLASVEAELAMIESQSDPTPSQTQPIGDSADGLGDLIDEISGDDYGSLAGGFN